MLHVYTARINYSGPDRFDVTRKSGGNVGTLFAPSWEILGPALHARKEASKMRSDAQWREAESASLRPDLKGVVLRNMTERAAQIEREAYSRYVPAYVEEMARSFERHRQHWDALLARTRVVLVCYCVDAEHCHRRILAEILGAKGAVDCGEIWTPPRAGRR